MFLFVPDVLRLRSVLAPTSPAIRCAAMALADTFQTVVDSLPDDWTDLELDLRIADETRYIDASVYLVTCNAQPYSKHDWHWRLLVAHRFGHARGAGGPRDAQAARRGRDRG